MGGVKKLISKVDRHVSKVTRVVDPAGAYLKDKVDTQAQKSIAKLLGMDGTIGMDGAIGLGGARAVSDESLTSVKARREKRASQRRQGVGAGSTLLVTEDDARLQGATLLGE